MKKIRIICLAIFSICFFTAKSFAQINSSQVMPLDPKVKIGRLANGLTYYIRHNNLPEKRVEMRLVVNAGSVQEDDDQHGLAHFMEHMNFNGTKHFPKNELVSYLQSIGVEFGADLNAYTSFDQTIYILPVPTDKPELVQKGLEILED
ncbi:MAG TPA: insulinase family protein, partial [Chitinophagaceae bacterium]|nr:insulinase family protein [Chitinophagaceae bacterium]